MHPPALAHAQAGRELKGRDLLRLQPLACARGGWHAVGKVRVGRRRARLSGRGRRRGHGGDRLAGSDVDPAALADPQARRELECRRLWLLLLLRGLGGLRWRRRDGRGARNTHAKVRVDGRRRRRPRARRRGRVGGGREHLARADVDAPALPDPEPGRELERRDVLFWLRRSRLRRRTVGKVRVCAAAAATRGGVAHPALPARQRCCRAACRIEEPPARRCSTGRRCVSKRPRREVAGRGGALRPEAVCAQRGGERPPASASGAPGEVCGAGVRGSGGGGADGGGGARGLCRRVDDDGRRGEAARRWWRAGFVAQGVRISSSPRAGRARTSEQGKRT